MELGGTFSFRGRVPLSLPEVTGEGFLLRAEVRTAGGETLRAVSPAPFAIDSTPPDASVRSAEALGGGRVRVAFTATNAPRGRREGLDLEDRAGDRSRGGGARRVDQARRARAPRRGRSGGLGGGDAPARRARPGGDGRGPGGERRPRAGPARGRSGSGRGGSGAGGRAGRGGAIPGLLRGPPPGGLQRRFPPGRRAPLHLLELRRPLRRDPHDRGLPRWGPLLGGDRRGHPRRRRPLGLDPPPRARERFPHAPPARRGRSWTGSKGDGGRVGGGLRHRVPDAPRLPPGPPRLPHEPHHRPVLPRRPSGRRVASHAGHRRRLLDAAGGRAALAPRGKDEDPRGRGDARWGRARGRRGRRRRPGAGWRARGGRGRGRGRGAPGGRGRRAEHRGLARGRRLRGLRRPRGRRREPAGAASPGSGTRVAGSSSTPSVPGSGSTWTTAATSTPGGRSSR